MKKHSDTIRVCRVIARLNVGGPAIHTILLTKLLSPERFDSTLITGQVSPTEGDMSYLADEHGVLPHYIPELGREINLRNDLCVLWKLYRQFRILKPAIVHTHTAKAGMLGRVAAKLAGVPVIIHTFHGHVFHSYFSPRKTQFFLWIERTLAKCTDAIITVSPKQREEILSFEIGRPDKVHAIGLGLELQQFVDCERHQGHLRQELGFDTETPLVGVVARLVPVKGLTYFLDAAQHVLKDIPNARFILAGDGELRESLELHARKLLIQSHVHFLGFRRDLPEIYADLDLVVLSSLNEGLPVALLEAMCAGKPVVATRVGGVGDLVQHEESGFLVPPKDSDALAQGIIEMLSLPHSKRIEMGLKGRTDVYPKYHIDTLVNTLETLYQTVSADKKRDFSSTR